jgi:6-phosphogluconolactonase (cycloisomerase 2 family)
MYNDCRSVESRRKPWLMIGAQMSQARAILDKQPQLQERAEGAGIGDFRSVLSQRRVPWLLTRIGLLLLMLSVGAFSGCSTQTTPPKNQTAYVADLSQNNISAFTLDSTTGALSQILGSPFPANCNGPVAFAVTPAHKFLYVPCAFGNTFSGLAIDANTGALTQVSTFLSGNNPFAGAIDPGGKFLYIANSGGNSVTGYSINSATGEVAAIVGASVTTNFAPNGLAIDPSGTFLYVSAATGNNGDLEGFSIDPASGALKALAGSPFASFLATAVKVHSSGKYIYVADEVNGVRAYSLNAGSGALAEIAGSPFPAGNEPFGIAVDPAGKFLYSANFVSNDVSGYTIDANSGKLTPVAGSPFHVGRNPGKVTVDTMGKFVYVPSPSDNTIWGFTINGTTGVLTGMPDSPFTASSASDVITIP